MKKNFLFFLILISQYHLSQVIESTVDMEIDSEKVTIRQRFSPPKGYSWIQEKPGSFGAFLTDFSLHPAGLPVRNYKGKPLANQNHHAALLSISVGDKDLQQCADAWIRLYSEYLWLNKKTEELVFHFTSGQPFSWKDFRNGVRPQEIKKKVHFVRSAITDSSYENFQNYLEVVFRYAGTISLDRESVVIKENGAVKSGDFILQPGSPGHLVIIVGAARNVSGKKVYLLAESFMPAQDIHILVNPQNRTISPWYELDVNVPRTRTAKYIFTKASIKRFQTLR